MAEQFPDAARMGADPVSRSTRVTTRQGPVVGVEPVRLGVPWSSASWTRPRGQSRCRLNLSGLHQLGQPLAGGGAKMLAEGRADMPLEMSSTYEMAAAEEAMTEADSVDR